MQRGTVIFITLVMLLIVFAEFLYTQTESIFSEIPQIPSPAITKTSTEMVQGLKDEKDPPEDPAHVSEVVDGDTLILGSGQKVRLIGMSAPEKDQPYYQDAVSELKLLTTNAQVRVETNIASYDRYGRLLAYLYIDDLMINEELLRRGVAVVETVPPNVAYQEKLTKAQKVGQETCQGIWEGVCQENGRKICIAIDSIQADAKGDDALNKNDEWIKIKNICPQEVDLTGYLLKDASASNSYIFPVFKLMGNSGVFLHSGCGKNTEDHLYWSCPERKNAVWNNEHDQAYLYSKVAKLEAYFGY